MSYQDIALRIFLALLTGLLIGFERERCKRAAGLKTHILTSIGSAVFAIAGLNFFYEYYQTYAGINPLYIITAVATGIGFIGAGSVIRSEQGVSGLSAAASIWIMGATGLAIGFGYYFLAIFSVLITYLVLIISEVVQKWRDNKCAVKKARQ
ncbi:MAG: MgtC/SapB family protein [Patescibacteria group bacterium]|nr:MgtC/SapB family protein [Patescibacteria group bacterium]MDD5490819.1 MgtC/SapB family protein [Patescibacteria group bacterium]